MNHNLKKKNDAYTYMYFIYNKMLQYLQLMRNFFSNY